MTIAPRDTTDLKNQSIQPQGEVKALFVNPQSKSDLTKSIDNVTSPSTENQSPLVESQSRDNASTPPTALGSAGDKQKLFIELLAGSNPGFRGADQAIYVNVLDYSSRTGIAQAKIAGVMAEGSGAVDFIKNYKVI